MASRETTLPLQKKSDILKLKVNVKLPLWQAMWLEIMHSAEVQLHTHSRPWYCMKGSGKLYAVPPRK